MNRLDASLWTDASQGSQRLPVRVIPAPEHVVSRTTRDYPSRASVEFLRRVVQHPVQYETNVDPSDIAVRNPDSDIPSYASLTMDVVGSAANSQLSAVAAEVEQEDAGYTYNQRTESGRPGSASQPTASQACS